MHPAPAAALPASAEATAAALVAPGAIFDGDRADGDIDEYHPGGGASGTGGTWENTRHHIVTKAGARANTQRLSKLPRISTAAVHRGMVLCGTSSLSYGRATEGDRNWVQVRDPMGTVFGDGIMQTERYELLFGCKPPASAAVPPPLVRERTTRLRELETDKQREQRLRNEKELINKRRKKKAAAAEMATVIKHASMSANGGGGGGKSPVSFLPGERERRTRVLYEPPWVVAQREKLQQQHSITGMMGRSATMHGTLLDGTEAADAMPGTTFYASGYPAPQQQQQQQQQEMRQQQQQQQQQPMQQLQAIARVESEPLLRTVTIPVSNQPAP